MFLGDRRNFPISSAELFLEALVDRFLVPMIMALVLYPFKIAHSHTTGIGQHIRDDKDAFFCQDVVCCWGGGAVCALDEDFGLTARSIISIDLVLERSGYEDIAGNIPKILSRDLFVLLRACQTTVRVFSTMCTQGGHI